MSGTDIKSESYALSHLKVVTGSVFDPRAEEACVVEFFATWCPPCVRSIPHLHAFQLKYPAVKIMSVSNEAFPVVNTFFQKTQQSAGINISYTVATDNTGELDSYNEQFRIQGIPHALVFRKGVCIFSGHPMEKGFESALATLQKERQEAAAAKPAE